ncbi:ATP-binding protein [Rhodopirellula sp. MGV]|uniref:ATP-binding protein n=1 Tax=Rhodopirellula sp. MGV TaxID=2023130 RepID=UPI000B9785AB|nr:ATP-binding protein [Rhodopirellula sp. MGV]OYP35195.1 hypothetical protein CGZ80_12410 [Rhodopirellula sp. MGV]PNY37791.1 hypothetical protein C2E31_05890 [Rhodopirellula baltica]
MNLSCVQRACERVVRVVDQALPSAYRTGDAEKLRVGRLTVNSAIIVFVAGTTYSLVYAVMGLPLPALAPGQAFFTAPLAFLLFRWTESTKIAGNMMALTCYVGVGGVLFTTGGINATGLCWFYFAPLIATMIGGCRSGLFWYSVSVATLVFLYWLDDYYLFPTTPIPAAYESTYRLIIAVGLITVVVAAGLSFGAAQKVSAQKLQSATELAEQACVKAELAHASAMLVVNNVAEGLVMVRLDGTFANQPSTRFCDWFDLPESGQTLWGWLQSYDQALADGLELGWEQLSYDWMPIELGIEQLPSRFHYDGKEFRLGYRPVHLGDRLEHLLVICTDITSELEAERASEVQREQMAIFSHFVRDPKSLIAFVKESDRLVSKLTSGKGSDAEERRWIHTLKGNCGLFGMNQFSRWIHQLENELCEEVGGCTNSQRDLIAAQWTSIRSRISTIIDIERADQISIDKEAFEATLLAAENGASSEALAMMMRRWSWDRVSKRLELIAERARQLAQRLGKEELEIDVLAADIRQPHCESWNAFWGSVVHVVRNAIDHGIEPIDERIQLGKDANGRVRLRAQEFPDLFVFEVADDGAGINWVKVAARCKKLGFPCETNDEMANAILTDGFSTKETVTEISGRGVGMAAVKEACQMLGGEIEIESKPNEGTTFRFIFPSFDKANTTNGAIKQVGPSSN